MIRISHSQLGSFDRCAFSWYLSHHEGYRSTAPTKDYFDRGNIVDSMLNIWYTGFNTVPAEERKKAIQAKFHEYFKAATSDDNMDERISLESLSRAMNAIEIYVNDYSPYEDRGITVLTVQKELEVTLLTPKGREYELLCIIDLAVRDEQGRSWLWDNKTVGKPPFWSEEQLLMDSQMATYNAVLQMMGKPMFGTIINQLNLHPYTKNIDMIPEKLFKRGEIFHSQRELDNHLHNTGLIVDLLLDRIDSKVYPLSRRRDCDGCNFAEPCIMRLKQGDEVMYDILNSAYHRRETQFNVDSR